MKIGENLIQSMVKLGFKEYQAKVYYTLASLDSASASEISRVSGVPRPRVYDTLNELIDIGAVNFHQGRPVYYKAVDPSRVIQQRRNEYLEASDEAIKLFEDIKIQKKEGESNSIWVLRGKNNIQQNIREMIKDAKSEIFLRFTNSDNYKEYTSELQDAKKRGVILKSLILASEIPNLKKTKNLIKLIEFGKISPDINDDVGISNFFYKNLANKQFDDMNNIDFMNVDLIITDNKQSLLTFSENKSYNFAIWSGVQIMVVIQKTLFEYIWKNAELI